MANFLGLDSINVLKDYIDAQVAAVNGETRIVTIQAYKYIEDTEERPITPEASVVGGTFDVAGATYIYPEGWGSLHDVLFALGEGVGTDTETIDYNKIDEKLAIGSIWMTVGVIEGNADRPDEYSAPVKISGQNGVSIRFAYSFDPLSEESDRTENPQGPSAENPVEYVYTKVGDAPWAGPTIFAMYAESGKDMKFVFKLTSDTDKDTYMPIAPATPGFVHDWSTSIGSLQVSPEKPYLWMCSKTITAGSDGNNVPWSDPALIGRWGEDGNVPDYVQVLYHKGYSDPEISDIEGIVRPEKPVFIDTEENPDATIADYFADGWVELPESEYVVKLDENGDPVIDENGDPVMIESTDPVIWWQCSIKVDGRTNKVLNADNIGAVKRYNAIDGNAKAGQFTMNLYAWSETQDQPEMSETLIDGWRPENYNYLPDRPLTLTSLEASLWMITANVSKIDEKGVPVVNGSWSEPVKLTGPRGPISYDYRVETRYMRGSENGPEFEPEEEAWYKDSNDPHIELTPTYPYLWAVEYLVYYKMKYADEPNIDGTYDIVLADDKATIVKDTDGKDITYGYYRLSGLNGADGSKKNSLKYSKAAEIVDINSFMTNYYVSNSADDVTYKRVFNFDTFIVGYTAKFANIGTGNVIIETTTDKPFAATGKTAVTMTLSPGESVELICCKDDGNEMLLVIGKSL